MDSITHIALGAIIGEACAGKKIGKQAMLIGALVQSLPDIDFIASFWMPTADNLVAHRGITHSILFGIVASLLLGLMAWKLHRSSFAFTHWVLFFGIEIFTHLFIDAFNAYGTGWFEPFNHERVSFHALFVADPFYFIWLGIAFIALLILKQNNLKRRKWMRFGLIMSSLYLGYVLLNKSLINDTVGKNLDKQHLAHSRFFATPTALNNWLWYIVAEDDTGYHIGYRSVFDGDNDIKFQYFSRKEKLLEPLQNQGEVKQLLRFAQGYYTVESWGDTIVFNDLRFGQIMGWNNPQSQFVFHYYLQHPTQNSIVIQRGRFSGWNRENIKSLLKRIKGN